ASWLADRFGDIDDPSDLVGCIFPKREIELESELQFALHDLELAAFGNIMSRRYVADGPGRLCHDDGGLIGVLNGARVGRVSNTKRLPDHLVGCTGRLANDQHWLMI